MAPPLLNATLPRRSLLFQLERQSTERWNHSRRVLLLGKKARRDFRVYDWAFRVHHFDVHHSTSAVGVGDYDTQQAGAVLCHSIYTSNCLKLPKQAGAVGEATDGEAQIGEGAGESDSGQSAASSLHFTALEQVASWVRARVCVAVGLWGCRVVGLWGWWVVGLVRL